MLRIQVAAAPAILSVVTTPLDKMARKANNLYTAFNFVEFAGGVILRERVNMTSDLWFNGTVTGSLAVLVLLKCTTGDE